MARRISRRSQGELLIHKWWFNVGLAVILLVPASLLLSHAHGSGSLVSYIAAVLLIILALNRIILGVRRV